MMDKGSILAVWRCSILGWASCASAPRASTPLCESKAGPASAHRSHSRGLGQALWMENYMNAKSHLSRHLLPLEQAAQVRPSDRIRVLIVDDHGVVRSGLAAFL